MNDTHEEPARGTGAEEPPPEAGESARQAVPGESARQAVSGEPARQAVRGEPVPEDGEHGRESAAAPEPAPLSARDRDVLALEGESFTGPGAKERAVRERLGMSPTRYYQLLNALLDDPAAEAHAPVTVHRLRRVREARRAER
ncbi:MULTISPECIES: DUF3263 domain-containing protein [unclassified Streptomyces]|uniref:DUF3263 domain-containing protein n=1 Tax=unclassified Streptomyces TaxID=2593676 RepID=UPI0001B54EB5|nr:MULTISPECIES: DUF3263 domain-containing protein [unclassified Streptomyces]EFL00750.1 conserved hypothetical protein [Streptomyces sp. SPB78]MYR28509.1 DUF3263 domain-containing protein [Streptomyces sp. SID4945]SCD30437.1 Protein of unknown function [Streptomyces sp. TverLS-915]SCF38454.1 Protein of unknown function [Streptomyces sp. LcepLS]